jgi:rare lipoprotein A
MMDWRYRFHAFFNNRFSIIFMICFGFMMIVAGSGCANHKPGGDDPYIGTISSPGRQAQPPAKTKNRTPGHAKPYRIAGKTYRPIASSVGFSQIGKASWYGKKFHGRKTANGETYNMYAMTAAHKTLPLGTWVRVDNLSNKKNVIVRVNDRGPFVTGRIIDLSYTAAQKMDIVGPGTAPVKVTALGRASHDPNASKVPVTYTPMNYRYGNFTVQVGAFKDKNNAERLKANLGKKYKNAHIVKYTDYRGLFYRVRVGKFSTLEVAEQFGDKLIGEGAKNTFTVAE